jgi:hypothetical protein
VAATNAKNTAAAAATAATIAANSAKTASDSTFDKLNDASKNLARDYKSSNPAALDPSTNAMRSARSMFTQAELDANTTLKTFVGQWDSFIEKQRDKFAAVAEQAAKEAALVVAQQTEAAVKAAANLATAKAAAQAALTNANSAKVEQERLRGLAETDAKTKA